MEPVETPSDFEDPVWFVQPPGGRPGYGEWTIYADDELRALWPTFTTEQKRAIARALQRVADAE